MAFAVSHTIKDKSNARRSAKRASKNGNDNVILVRSAGGWMVVAGVEYRTEVFADRAGAAQVSKSSADALNIGELDDGRWVVFLTHPPVPTPATVPTPTPDTSDLATADENSPQLDAGNGQETTTASDEREKPRKRTRSAATDERGCPIAPDFSAATHAPHRKKLVRLIELFDNGDIAGLRSVQINPTSTSPRALLRYRDAAVAFLGRES